MIRQLVFVLYIFRTTWNNSLSHKWCEIINCVLEWRRRLRCARSLFIPADPMSTKICRCQRNLCIVWMSFSTMSEYTPKITPRPSECSRRPSLLRLIRKLRQLSSMCCAIWLFQFLTNYDTHYISILRIMIYNSSSKCTKSTSCIFSFQKTSKITKLMKYFWKKPR